MVRLDKLDIDALWDQAILLTEIQENRQVCSPRRPGLGQAGACSCSPGQHIQPILAGRTATAWLPACCLGHAPLPAEQQCRLS